MTKYIKLEELMKFPVRRNHYNKVHGNDFVSGIEMVLEYAKNIPAADVAPVRHGYWVIDDNNTRECHCSECEWPAPRDVYEYHREQTEYCPVCGAKMEIDYYE